MGILYSAVSAIESVMLLFGNLTKKNLDRFCDVQTADSQYNFVTDNLSFLTISELVGSTQLVGNDEHQFLMDGLNNALASSMSSGAYAFQICFKRDFENSIHDIDLALKPSQISCRRIGLDFDELFEHRKKNLSRFIVQELNLLSTYTRPSLFTKVQKKSAETRKKAAETDLAVLAFAQRPTDVYADLRVYHDAFVQGLLDSLKTYKVDTKKCEVHDALLKMRYEVDPEFTSADWRANLPGDPPPIKIPNTPTRDLSDLFWPTIPYQVVPREGERLDHTTFKLGDRLYSVMFIDVHPQDSKQFHELFSRIPFDLPWRVSFLIEGNGLDSIPVWKRMSSSMLAFSNAGNGLIRDAIKHLSSERESGQVIVKFRVVFATWAKDTEQLAVRKSLLAQAIQGWGRCDVREEAGDVAEGIASTLPGFMQNSVGTPAAAHLDDILGMLPWLRPSSPWDAGGILFRTQEGKLWPYQPGSAVQTSGIDLLFAKPGMGKSVLANLLNLAFVVAAGIGRIDELPYCSVIDIGPSSEGLVDLIKEALPEGYKHWAAYHRMRLTEKYAINVMDVQLGMRRPLPHELSFIINFVVRLATPAERTKPYENSKAVIYSLVTEAYKYFDSIAPKKYQVGIDQAVDSALDDANIKLDESSTWWEVVDDLFAVGDIKTAWSAQRYAVPNCDDLIGVLSESVKIKTLYGEIRTDSGQTLIKAISTNLTATLGEYPILRRPTAFDLGETRIVSLDLEEVAPKGNQFQSSIMYMLARFALVKNYFLHPDHVPEFNAQYRSYQESRIYSFREIQKRFGMDEFHRTEGDVTTRTQAVEDMREGRKRGVHIWLASQMLHDFDADMLKMSNNTYILGGGNQSSLDEIEKVFGLTPSEYYALKHYVHGPSESGSSFLFKFSTKKHDDQTQLLVITAGSEELWALSTTPNDTKLRRLLTKELGGKDARRVLARFFPSGSAEKEVDKRKKDKQYEKSTSDSDDIDIIANLANEIITKIKSERDTL